MGRAVALGLVSAWLVAGAWACGGSRRAASEAAPAPAARVAAPMAAEAVAPLSEADRAAAALPEEELPELEAKPARALPDGVFVGTARAIAGSSIEIVVRNGRVTEARYKGPSADDQPIELAGRGQPDADALALTGRNERDYLQIRGTFVDAERISGDYSGGLAKKAVEGEWFAVRR
jgi:hypothetical protein